MKWTKNINIIIKVTVLFCSTSSLMKWLNDTGRSYEFLLHEGLHWLVEESTWYFLLFSISSLRFTSHNLISFSTFFNKASRSYKKKEINAHCYLYTLYNIVHDIYSVYHYLIIQRIAINWFWCKTCLNSGYR